MRWLILQLALSAFLIPVSYAHAKVENVILITLDGVRPQEMFGGLDLGIVHDKLGDDKIEHSDFAKYAAGTPEKRRMIIMPFFWGVLMKKYGSIAGNPGLHSAVTLTNHLLYSYPGYHEMLTGTNRDELIKANDKIRNPDTTVLEFLKRKMNLDKRMVAIFSSWERLNLIGEHEEGAITVNAGHAPYEHPDPEIKVLSDLQKERLGPWHGLRLDYFTFRFAMAHLKTYHPRVMHLVFGETDEWAHEGCYEYLLQTLRRFDSQLETLWNDLQSTPQYRDKTAILITTDHGRGATPKSWIDHGADQPESRHIWMAFITPDSPLRGEWKDSEQIYLNQVPATLARLLGFDYNEFAPEAGKPVARIFSKH